VDEHVHDADLVVAFEPSGITGHPDHRAASAAARRVALDRGLPLLEWGLSPAVADVLRGELGVPFTALVADAEADLVEVEVDRRRQWERVRCRNVPGPAGRER
jgi:LmbE family N-acetylglucosaminyl deacetylase